MRKYLSLFFSLFLVVAAVGLTSRCAHIGQALGIIPEKPDISLVGARIKSATLASVEIEIKINIANQDKKDLRVDDLTFDLIYGDSVIGQGKITDKINIKSQGSQIVDVPVNIQTGKILGVAAEIMDGGSLGKSRIRGQATFVTWLGSIDIPFDRKIVN